MGGVRDPDFNRDAGLGEVAETGLVVAAIRAEETARPDRLFADPLASAFAAAAGRAQLKLSERARWRALQVWVVARTVFLDDLLLSACRNGCRQVVLLGAGFDARAFRLPWPTESRCFELDTADVLEHKQRVLAAEAALSGCERIPVACDLREDWPAKLVAAGFQPGARTVWIAEGLLVYLTPQDVDSLLAVVTSLSAPGSTIGLTLSNRDPSRAGRLRRSSAPEDPVRWLAGHGWAAETTTALAVLAAHGRPIPAKSADLPPSAPEGGRPRALLVSAVREASG